MEYIEDTKNTHKYFFRNNDYVATVYLNKKRDKPSKMELVIDE